MTTEKRSIMPPKTAIVGPAGKLALTEIKSPATVCKIEIKGVRKKKFFKDLEKSFAVIAGIIRRALTSTTPTTEIPSTTATPKSR